MRHRYAFDEVDKRSRGSLVEQPSRRKLMLEVQLDAISEQRQLVQKAV